MRKVLCFSVLSASLLASCGTQATTQLQTAKNETVNVVIDPQGFTKILSLSAQGVDQHGEKNTALQVDSGQIEFFSNELIIKAKDDVSLRNFLKKYNAQLISSATIPQAPQGILSSDLRTVKESNWFLVKLNAPPVELQKFADNLSTYGYKGKVKSPDQETINQYNLSLTLNEPGITSEVNYVLKSAANPSANEHKSNAVGGYRHPRDDWWLDSTGTDYAWAGGYGLDPAVASSGRGVKVAIIDVGFTPNDWDITGYDPVTNTSRSRSIYSYDFSRNQYDITSTDGDPDYNGTKWHGHGTAAIAMAAQDNHYGTSGVAPDATPLLFRIGRSSSGLLSYYDAGRAVDTAIAWGAGVISMSFTATMPGGAGIPNTYLGDALNRADAAGVVSVAAMGNENKPYDSNRYPWALYPIPAIWPQVISVGATNRNFRKASYSNYGAAVQIWAPGGEYYSDALQVGPSVNGSAYCYTSPNFCKSDPDAVEPFNGTSAATPFVAGVIALMKEKKPSLNRTQILAIFQKATRKGQAPDPLVDNVGILDTYAAMAYTIR